MGNHFVHQVIIDSMHARTGGGQERQGGQLIHPAVNAAAGLVNVADGLWAKDLSLSAGQAEMVLDVLGRLLLAHAAQVSSAAITCCRQRRRRISSPWCGTKSTVTRYDARGRRLSQTIFNHEGEGQHTIYYEYDGPSSRVLRERNQDGEVVALTDREGNIKARRPVPGEYLGCRSGFTLDPALMEGGGEAAGEEVGIPGGHR